MFFKHTQVCSFFIILVLNKIQTQIVDDSYVCVPAGYCDNNKTPQNPEIDPRILTSGEVCTDGTVPCYTQGPNSFCGERFIQQTITADGPVTERGVHPWLAYLQFSNNSYAGGGVLLDNYHVLTAAHKVDRYTNTPENLRVIMGVHNPITISENRYAQTRTVSRIDLHEDYDAGKGDLKDDIAVLTVDPPFRLSEDNVNTACLPAATSSFVARRCVVAGWGQTSFTNYNYPTNPLKQVHVNITNYTTCRNGFVPSLGNRVDYYLDQAGEICAGGEPNKDACTHDGGSPLICASSSGKHVIAGLVIWGKNCGQPGVYGVYVNPAAYIDWIQEIISDPE